MRNIIIRKSIEIHLTPEQWTASGSHVGINIDSMNLELSRIINRAGSWEQAYEDGLVILKRFKDFKVYDAVSKRVWREVVAEFYGIDGRTWAATFGR